MPRVKNISGGDVRCEWLPAGYADPDEEIDVPDKQPDTSYVDADGKTVVVPGEPLIWHPDIWEDVTPKKTAAAKKTEDVS